MVNVASVMAQAMKMEASATSLPVFSRYGRRETDAMLYRRTWADARQRRDQTSGFYFATGKYIPASESKHQISWIGFRGVSVGSDESGWVEYHRVGVDFWVVGHVPVRVVGKVSTCCLQQMRPKDPYHIFGRTRAPGSDKEMQCWMTKWRQVR